MIKTLVETRYITGGLRIAATFPIFCHVTELVAVRVDACRSCSTEWKCTTRQWTQAARRPSSSPSRSPKALPRTLHSPVGMPSTSAATSPHSRCSIVGTHWAIMSTNVADISLVLFVKKGVHTSGGRHVWSHV